MANNQQVAITLTAENWKVIMDFVKYSCQLKGDGWIKWGQGINQIIQASIDKSVITNPANGIKRTAVSSSNLNSAGYDLKTQTLEIQFNDGSVYQYHQVPQEIYVGLMKAESHGSYFYAMIRNVFQYKKVGYEPIQGERKTASSRFDDDGDYDYGDEEKFDPHDDAFGTWIDDKHWVSYDDD